MAALSMEYIGTSFKSEFAVLAPKLNHWLKNYGVNVLKLQNGGWALNWMSGTGMSRLGMKLESWWNVYKTSVYVQTLDLDCKDSIQLQGIVSKILSLNCNEGVSVKPSALKGYHCTLFCFVPGCDLCRRVFDDQVRFDRDQEREPGSRNILWDDKTTVAPRVTASRRQPKLLERSACRNQTGYARP